MANLKDIRNRIRSVKNTSQITRAMQLVAASKMKRAQDLAIEGRPYSKLLAEMLANVNGRVSEADFEHPFMQTREVRHRGVLLITTDKGLCGPLNSNLFREIQQLEGDVRYVAIGRKGTQFLARTKRDMIGQFNVSDHAHYREVRPVVNMLIESYEKGEIDTIEVAMPAFKNTLVQEPQIRPLLPLHNVQEALDLIAMESGETEPTKEDEREMLFEPSISGLLDELLDLYIGHEVYHFVLESKASEHSARMVAMKTATDNANKLVDQLTLEYNKARQAAITQEILEISAAAAY